MDKIPAKEIRYKKKVGTLDGKDVIEVGLIGGLHLLVHSKAPGSASVIGTGPNRAVARHIAMKRNPELRLTELSKSDYIEEAHYLWLVPQYEELTDIFSGAGNI